MGPKQVYVSPRKEVLGWQHLGASCSANDMVAFLIRRVIAQLVEHRSPKPRVVGSSPTGPATVKIAAKFVYFIV